MKLNSAPFEDIKKGEKLIEIRLNDKKRQRIKIGDKIQFTKRCTTKEKLLVQVESLVLYKTFGDLFDGNREDLYFSKWNRENFIESCYEYYSRDDEAKYGALGMRIKICNKNQ